MDPSRDRISRRVVTGLSLTIPERLLLTLIATPNYAARRPSWKEFAAFTVATPLTTDRTLLLSLALCLSAIDTQRDHFLSRREDI